LIVREFRGLSAEVLLSKKLVFLEGNTCQTRLGLAEEVYEEVRFSIYSLSGSVSFVPV
jgi:hypothetical protein